MPSFSAPSVKYRQPRRPVFYDSGHENQPREQRDHQRPPRANYAPPSGPSSPMDYEQSAKAAVRVTNLQHLKRALFNDSLAEMALQAGVQPVRLARMLDLEMIVDPGIAEHMERCMGLRPGFLDVRRDKWDESLTSEVRAQIKADETTNVEPHDAPSPANTAAKEGSECPALSLKPVSSTASEANSMIITIASTSEAQQPVTAAPVTNAPASGSQWARYEHAGLRWLGEQLARMPRGSQTRLAALMGRSASDISAWVNCLRPVPASAMPQLVDAVTRLDASLGEQARAKLTVSAAKSEPLSDNLSDKRVTQAAPEPEKAPESAQNAAVVVAQPVQVAAEAVAKAVADLAQTSSAVAQAVGAEKSAPVIQAPGYVGPDRRSTPAKAAATDSAVPPAAVQAEVKAPPAPAHEVHTSLDQPQPVVYIQAPGYSGPERRVSQSSNYTGPERRKASQHLVLNEAEMLALRTVQSIAETLNRLTKTSG